MYPTTSAATHFQFFVSSSHFYIFWSYCRSGRTPEIIYMGVVGLELFIGLITLL